MRKSICALLATLLAMSAFLAGCNTIEGFGRDVEKVGDKIENKAKR